ncbi:hypothetical protein PanWU01x14_124600 [Parasponia andersonii]|uniref:RNase H type-1 domain-containing protein n=1 Tax=Parasponia andersonii TaxID=3476 RepID=A0A2P5CTP1_PARAD|nr:hypothetical protein PanWU01x14_124600 [Parasponia andersonii]
MVNSILPRVKVAEFITADRVWDRPKLSQYFCEEDIRAILAIPIPLYPKSDHYFLGITLVMGSMMLRVAIGLLHQWITWLHRLVHPLLPNGGAVHGQSPRCAPYVVRWARSYLENYFRAQSSNQRSLPQHSLPLACWIRPEEGRYKLNVDATLDSTSGLLRIGTIIDDRNGEVIGALAKNLNGELSAVEAKAVALLRNWKWAKHTSVPLDSVKIDVLSVLNLYSGRENCFSQLRGLLLDIHVLLSYFPCVSLVHVR